MLFDSDNMVLDYSILDLANLNKEDIVNNSNVSLVDDKEGFLRGNMFKDEYLPYKNLTYVNLKPSNERESKLWDIMKHEFVINDLNLYLDLHPEDKYVLGLLEKTIKEVKKDKEEFIRMYGPLEVCDTYGDEFDWIDSPWPFEDKGGTMYV